MFACSNINETHLNNQIEDDHVISSQIVNYNIDLPDYDGGLDDNDAKSKYCNCSSGIQLHYFTQENYFYFSQFIGCFISHETDKSPPFIA